MAIEIRDRKWISDMLGLDEDEVDPLLNSGQIRALRVGNKWLVQEKDVIAFLDREADRQTAELREKASQPLRTPAETHKPSSNVEAYSRNRRFLLFGREHEARSSIDLLAQVLQILAERDPEFMLRFSKLGTRSRHYVAQDPKRLYLQSPHLAESFVKRLAGGWWLGTDYNKKEIEAILEKACGVAGVVIGVDLILLGPKQDIDIGKAMAFVGSGHDPKSDVARRHDEYYVEALTSGRS